MRIKKGDTVKILYGKEKGKRGPVIAINVKKDRVIVEGLNLYKKHIKGDGQSKVSEVVTIEKPFPISKVMLICPHCDKPTRIGMKVEKDKKVRVCKKCGKEIVKDLSKEKEKEEKKEVKKEEKKESKTKPKSKVKKE
ncbi:MAG: 50S ribosomal protein L24 [Candidatus Dojkabacteria bacterium]